MPRSLCSTLNLAVQGAVAIELHPRIAPLTESGLALFIAQSDLAQERTLQPILADYAVQVCTLNSGLFHVCCRVPFSGFLNPTGNRRQTAMRVIIALGHRANCIPFPPHSCRSNSKEE